jgi:hypothetical protein
MGQGLECLLNNHETLSSSPSTVEKKKKRKDRSLYISVSSLLWLLTAPDLVLAYQPLILVAYLLSYSGHTDFLSVLHESSESSCLRLCASVSL